MVLQVVGVLSVRYEAPQGALIHVRVMPVSECVFLCIYVNDPSSFAYFAC